MHQGTRKFFPNERSVPKQSKPTYHYVSQHQKDPTHPYYGQYPVKKELIKINSDAELRIPKEEYFKNLNQRRKNDDQRSHLKFELQNLKSEVSKLITKDTLLRTPIKQRAPLTKQEFSQGRKVNYVSTKQFHDQQQFTDKEDDFSDTASMTSVTTEKVLNQPLRRLQKKASNQNYDQSYYMHLENDLLKTEIKNLKNKYVSKKRELSQKNALLEKKIQFLQVSLHKSQQALAETRNALQMEIITIKRQITLRTEIKSDVHLPESDKPSAIVPQEGNEMLQQKLKKLYEQVSEKNKRINNLSIQMGDIEVMLQKKKYDLKKQTQKSLQLSKQLQLAKRESSRLQIVVETELSKKKDLIKQNEEIKLKNRELMQEIYKKEQIVTGSEQYESRMIEQIEGYKKKEDELQERVSVLREENKKLKQVILTNDDEIATLKKSHDDTITRIAQLSKKLKQQQQKSQDREQYYRKLLQQAKSKQQQKLRILKQHYETQYSTITKSATEQSQIVNGQVNQLIKQKQRQINKWKAEYKILKLKYQQRHTSQKMRNQQVEKYYKNYIEFKTKVSLLNDKNRLLQQNVDGYRKKLNEKISESAKQELQHQKAIKTLNESISHLNHQIQNLNDELSITKAQLNELIPKNEQQIKYRQQIQAKIQKFISKQLNPDSQQSESENQHVQQQKLNKSNGSDEGESSSPTKISKKFLEDQQLEKQPQSSEKKLIKKDSKSLSHNKLQPLPLSQSEKLQLEQLSEAITTIKKRIIQQDQKLAKNVRELKNKDAQITKLKKQIRELLEAHEIELNDIKSKYVEQKTEKLLKASLQAEKSFKQLCQKEIENYKNKFNEILSHNVDMKRQISEFQKESLDLRQQTKSLSHLYNVKCSEVQEFVERSLKEIALKESKFDELQFLKQQKEGILLNEISNLKDEISTLRIDIKNLISINQKIEAKNFDQALKNQIETSKSLREQLAKKNEEIFKVRDNYTSLRSQYDNLRSESQMQKLKNLSERKNIEIQYQIQMQNLKNKQNIDEKRISSLEQKIALIIEENKKKDSFIQSYIMGKKLPQNQKELVASFMKQYEICLNGKPINEKLRADSQELEKMATYNYRLLKDLAEMKEKMLLYETMEGEALSFYDSKHSEEFNRQIDLDSPNSSSKNSSSNRSPQSSGKKFKKMMSLKD